MRRFALVLAALALVPAAGCSHRAPRAPRVREVVFWASRPAPGLAPLLARFEAENAGVRVNLRALEPEQARDTIDEALRTGRAPDLCELASADMPGYLARGALSDWSAGVADLRDSLSGWPMCMLGDAIYGMPWTLRPEILYADEALLRRAGVRRVPATWDELLSAAQRIQKLGHGVHGIGIPERDSVALFDAFMALAAGDSTGVLSGALDTTCLDAPRKVAALALLVRLRRASGSGASEELASAFAAGRLGFLLAPLGGSPRVQAGCSPVPVPAAEVETPATFARGQVLVSFTSSRRKEEALRLARFLADPANAAALAASQPGALPANAGAADWPLFRGRPAERALLAGLPRARYAPNAAHWPDMQRAIAGQLVLAMAGGTSAPLALAAADSALTEWITRRGH